MEKIPTPIPGCFVLRLKPLEDARGSFVKSFHFGNFKSLGIDLSIREIFHSKSHPGVLRGFHFQIPPHDHDKLVACVEGEVLDVALDLRKGSPTFGKTYSASLSAARGEIMILPAGLAHAFYVPSAPSTLLYAVSREYAPAHDRGIRWDSVDFQWPSASPILSARDQSFPALADFESPFTWNERA